MSRLVLAHHFWILLAAVAVFFTNLGAAGLFDEDEPKNAACAREMLERGDWVVPQFNGELRTDKPVLLYWLTMAAYTVFGVSEFGARFASATLAVGTVVVTYHIGRILFRPQAAVWGALAMTSALMFDVLARAATPDSTLIFCTTAALLAYVWTVSRRATNVWQSGQTLPLDEPAAPYSACTTFAPHAWWGAVAIYAAMGLAMLAKGPVGVVLPTAAIGLFVLVASTPWIPGDSSHGWHDRLVLWLHRAVRPFDPRRVVRAALALRPLVAIVTLAVVVLPWYVLVGLRTDGAWLAGFLGRHNVGRFLEPLENHSGPFFYYLIALMIGFFPWSIFFTLAGIHTTARLRERHPWRAGYLLLVCWLATYVIFFSLARTKLPNYVLPVYPALALLTGALLDQWITAPAAISRKLLQLALGTLGVVGLGIVVGLPIAAYFLLPGEWSLGLVGLIPLAGAALALCAVQKSRPQLAVTSLAVACTLFATGIFGFAAVRVARHQNSPALAAIAREHTGGTARMAAFDCFVPSLVFYGDGPVRALQMPDDVAEHLRQSPDSFVIVRDENLALLADSLPDDVQILARQPRFLRRGELVLLGRSTKPVAELAEISGLPAEETQR